MKKIFWTFCLVLTLALCAHSGHANFFGDIKHGFNKVGDGLKDATNKVKHGFNKIGDGLKDAQRSIDKAMRATHHALKDAAYQTGDFMKDAANQTGKAFVAAGKATGKGLGAAGKYMYDHREDIMNGLQTAHEVYSSPEVQMLMQGAMMM